MRSWSRWQDWVALVAGVYAFLSPIWTATVTRATVALLVLGIITAAAALASLARPKAVLLDGLVSLLGVVFFISPWVLSFHSIKGAAWTAWVVGVVAFVVGLWALPTVNRARHGGRLAGQH